MAVRHFDLTEPQSSRLRGLEAAPVRRRDLRRIRQRYAVLGIAALTVPFVAAVVVLALFRNREFLELWSAFHQKFWKTDLADPENRPIA